MVKKNSCVFISGKGTNLKALIDSTRNYNFPVNIKMLSPAAANTKSPLTAVRSPSGEKCIPFLETFIDLTLTTQVVPAGMISRTVTSTIPSCVASPETLLYLLSTEICMTWKK